mgnify:CR=1 FL=1
MYLANVNYVEIIMCSYNQVLFLILVLILMPHCVVANEIDNAIDAGKQEFFRSCTLCHGEDAKGNGRWAAMLTVPVSNLTLLQKNNNNHFPFAETYKTIDGRDKVRAHELMNMPSWSERFSPTMDSVEGKYSETVARGKIFELLLYLQSIQVE